MTLTEKKQKGWQRSMRLLIDANVILDVLQNREPHVKDSAAIWRLCETRQAEGFISALTFANLVYIVLAYILIRLWKMMLHRVVISKLEVPNMVCISNC